MSSDPIGPEELASILRNVGDGLTAQSPDGRLVYANDAAAQLCGLASAAEMLSLSGAELLERFEIIGEDGNPLPIAELPSRRALQERETQEAVLVGYRILPDGDERWSIVRSTPILNDAGEIRLVITVFHDVTEQRHAEERIRFLAETGTLFSAGLDYAATLAELGALLVPRLADYCLVDVIEEESGSLRQVVISHRDPEREQLLRTLRQRYPPEKNASHPVTEVLRTGEPYLVEDARDAALSRAAVDEEHLELYRQLEATSYIVVPLESRGRLLGTISLGTGGSGRRFSDHRPRAGTRDRPPRRARDRECAPLPRRARVVCAARHAARLRPGGNRLLGSRAALRARERCACAAQPALAGGAHRENAARDDPEARSAPGAALPARARDRRAGCARGVDR